MNIQEWVMKAWGNLSCVLKYSFSRVKSLATGEPCPLHPEKKNTATQWDAKDNADLSQALLGNFLVFVFAFSPGGSLPLNTSWTAVFLGFARQHLQQFYHQGYSVQFHTAKLTETLSLLLLTPFCLYNKFTLVFKQTRSKLTYLISWDLKCCSARTVYKQHDLLVRAWIMPILFTFFEIYGAECS